MTAAAIALYGRTYWDVTVDVELATLGGGKGKLDHAPGVVAGGFAANAARVLGVDAEPGAIRVVTVAGPLDLPRVRADLPPAVALDALAPGDDGWLPITVVINPGRECRILRDRRDRTDACWQLAALAPAAAAAALHVTGRLPAGFVTALADHAHGRGARIAWCGGADLPPALDRGADLVCVNAREAAALLGEPIASTRAAAAALLARCDRDDAVRVVTGAGAEPAAAAWRARGAVEVIAAHPPPIARDRIATLLGAGDTFAAAFCAAACFDRDGRPRAALAVPDALAIAHATTAAFLTGGRA